MPFKKVLAIILPAICISLSSCSTSEKNTNNAENNKNILIRYDENRTRLILDSSKKDYSYEIEVDGKKYNVDTDYFDYSPRNIETVFKIKAKEKNYVGQDYAWTSEYRYTIPNDKVTKASIDYLAIKNSFSDHNFKKILGMFFEENVLHIFYSFSRSMSQYYHGEDSFQINEVELEYDIKPTNLLEAINMNSRRKDFDISDSYGFCNQNSAKAMLNSGELVGELGNYFKDGYNIKNIVNQSAVKIDDRSRFYIYGTYKLESNEGCKYVFNRTRCDIDKNFSNYVFSGNSYYDDSCYFTYVEAPNKRDLKEIQNEVIDDFLGEYFEIIEQNKLRVTFNSGFELVIPEQYIECGDFIEFPKVSREGYTFQYWEMDGNHISRYEKIYTDVTIDAYWLINKYEVSVLSNDLNKGSTTGGGYYSYLENATIEAIPNNGFEFDGWYCGNEKVSLNLKYTFAVTGHATLTAVFIKEESDKEKNDRLMGITPDLSFDAKTLTYGIYPQSHVNDEIKISQLNNLTSCNDQGYYLYDGLYYAKYTVDSYYAWDQYFSDGTKIERETTYWFLCEPIIWDVLDISNNEYLCFSRFLLDTTTNSNKGNVRYDTSELRNWLNGDFLFNAFSLNETFLIETKIDNSSLSTYSSDNEFCCEDTNDKVWVLSAQETQHYNSLYWKNFSLLKRTTDYCRARDIRYCKKDTYYLYGEKYEFNGSYWTRSPAQNFTECYGWNIIEPNGTLKSNYEYFDREYWGNKLGICPTIKVNFTLDAWTNPCYIKR